MHHHIKLGILVLYSVPKFKSSSQSNFSKLFVLILLIQKLQDLLSDLDLSKSSSQELNQQMRDLLNTITATQQRKKQLANEEMRAVMGERDAAVTKVTNRLGCLLSCRYGNVLW